MAVRSLADGSRFLLAVLKAKHAPHGFQPAKALETSRSVETSLETSSRYLTLSQPVFLVINMSIYYHTMLVVDSEVQRSSRVLATSAARWLLPNALVKRRNAVGWWAGRIQFLSASTSASSRRSASRDRYVCD